MSSRSLSAKERLFVAEYLKDQNATQAIIRCGYTGKNARVVGPRMYAKVSVRAAIDSELARIAEKVGVTQERILGALLAIAEADPRKLFKRDGTMKALLDMPDDVASTIASIESDDKDGSLKKVRFWDKPKALELLGKYLKMFVDRGELTGPDGKPIPVKGGTIDFSGLTTAELKNLARKADAATR